MTTRVGTHEAKTHLSEYLNRVAYSGERVVVERHGKPVAALVSVDDLVRLEAMDAGQAETSGEAEREAIFRRRLAEKGVVVHWTEGPPVPPSERKPLKIEGQPLSEQIIAERR
ncbi:MAG: type II toxin-antitoxin system Phd/YefM family antitoxin [Dehalococcoidia bacterium]|nr:type II toxin-antitoxin system Phd/YefM family antitoxin [Dehalococcoidia bacterium]